MSIMLTITAFILTLFAVTVPEAWAIVSNDKCNGTFYNVTYCGNANICPNGGPHVSCLLNKLAPACGTGASAYALPVGDTLQKRIITRINAIRNEVAGGSTTGADGLLPKAARAGYVTWNCPFAYYARLQAMQCNLQTDKCHNTNQYARSGQLIYNNCGSIGFSSFSQTIENAFDTWISYRNVTNISDIGNFTSHDGNGNFTLLVTDRNTAVGCGMSNFRNTTTNVECYTLICNFAVDNTEGCPVYTIANVSGADCRGCSGTSENLCDAAENYANTCPVKSFCPNEAAALCPTGTTHIACLTPIVNSSYLISNTDSVITMFTSYINTWRNFIAAGNSTNANSTSLPAASKSVQATWSPYLARLAQIHAASCSANKYECVNSYSFKNTGQTVFIATNLTDVTNTNYTMELAVRNWFSTRATITPEIIENYISSPDYEPFAILAHEKMSKLGCAMAINENTACTVCYYAANPEPGCAVYTATTSPGSQCPLGTSYYYPNLCNANTYVSSNAPITYDTSTC